MKKRTALSTCFTSRYHHHYYYIIFCSHFFYLSLSLSCSDFRRVNEKGTWGYEYHLNPLNFSWAPPCLCVGRVRLFFFIPLVSKEKETWIKKNEQEKKYIHGTVLLSELQGWWSSIRRACGIPAAGLMLLLLLDAR